MSYGTAALTLNIMYFSLAVIAGWAVLRLLDHMSRMRFTKNFEEIKNANVAMALYLGLRFVGVCIVASSFIR